ncbi:unnamed protein product [Mytilus edulis]|uniref:Uncharacterized protein n=1 Tax=Mytilus edulis TaxID=6550 RepID=A0A8S3Q4N4_MYTED|nr:unnamed protein product [Mytilus edulis]
MDAPNLPESSSKLFDNFEYVVAIDIGTIYSAFAFAHKDDINFDTGEMNIICNQPWHCGKANFISLKTPTCIPSEGMVLPDVNGRSLLAETAGITDNHLIIALEPEAASIYCQYVKTRGNDDTFKVSKPGTQYMVVDLGEFEAAKKAFDQNSDDMSISLPTIFIEALCKAMHLESLQQILHQGPHIGGLHLSAGNFLHISSELVKEKLFDPTAEKIEQLVSTVISSTNNANITKILLVGGLAESKYIQDFFRLKFPLQTLIIPRKTDLCVVKGAVMFGHTPTRISHRVSRYTYGSNFSPTFDNSIHDEKRKRIIDGVDRCVGVFDIFFKMGTVIEIDTNVKRTYVTVDKFQKSLDLSLFASTKENPTYTNEEGCTKIGDYVLVLQNPTEELKRIEVNIVFGNTEISVHAHDASGKLCDIYFHYHDNIP